MSKSILLVDDEPQLLFSLKEYLAASGYRIVPAENGAKALQMLVDDPPDIIISDVLMEGMDGFEFQRRVNALTGDSIPFIFLSAKTDLQDRLAALRNGADDYVTKPFEPEELEARVAAVINRVEQTRAEVRREMERLRSRILVEVAKRLKAPVISLVSHLSLLLSDRFGENELEQLRYLRNALEDANVLSQLVSDLSWATGDETQAIVVNKEPLRVAPILRASAASTARLAAAKEVEVNISCGGLLSGNLDGKAMTRALEGLLGAAVELAPTGEKVSIAARRASEGGIEITVTDAGCGADDEAASPEMSDALDLARRVVKAHGGEVSARQEEDGRQSFILWLPGRITRHTRSRR